ncbi:hypothetical protein D5041_14065 [Verminephrobacter aporrectodeae subsp. tuberculatae]|uniref:hypothetical protein n=1 Tax=Verminephrobacter aporrectodeae TaxID=1110389 RepID=UPI000237502D|nr:hypothetical protein [Verminephrobacter aporrectodeae]MCW5220832.1 hypothetical protein [Verminephrobacter aporrectodeae subsp. tuberculatae]MCW5255207.1 hypothetical protein [Verminephrobacter aporrectodeae subsp. tuberculatae]MCW5290127.1 hypothetical protein [Verminephrobacter aporrectodeae subsp. tuberculatae]MCW8164094.1 hypothetical protein [Verminephrobacter aporrectodeae subsp. tuberculatae]MCW8168239.1 hypothetical protein [Verminephrobacter aporrectodeae subsp. tuberculatae]
MTSPLSTPTELRPTAEQQRVLERIEQQRERLRARRAARVQLLAMAGGHERVAGGMDESLALRAVGFAREHPLALAALAGVAIAAGPHKLMRWVGVVLPLLLRLGR